MKQLKYILILTLLFVSMTITVYAEPSENEDIPLGQLTIKADVPSELADVKATVQFDIINTTINKTFGIYLYPEGNYDTMNLIEFGDYKIVEGTAVVLNKTQQRLDCTVELEPFSLNEENPNGDWSWTVTVKVIPNNENALETKNFFDVDDNKETSTVNTASNNTEENTSNNDGNTFTVPADNKYFPNMTLTEIKKWYIDEVNAFNASGGTTKNGTTYTLEECQKSVGHWAEWVYKNKEKQMAISYRGCVEAYNTEDTQEFYQVQKKIFDFIKEYEQENNTYLNFENWDKVAELESSTEPITSTNAEVPTDETETTSSAETEETTTLEPTEPTTEDTSDKDKEGKSIFGTYFFTIVIMIIVLIGGLIWKIKLNKSEDI